MSQTDVSAATATATGTIVNQPARVKSIYFVSSATAGTLSFRNGGAGGTELIRIDTPAGIGDVTVYIPDNGVRFTANVHVTMTNTTSVTIFYG